MKETIKRWLGGMSFQAKTVVVSLLGAVLLLVLMSMIWPGDAGVRRATKLRDVLNEKVTAMVDRGEEMARDDGFVYAVDIGLLLQYAALRKDRPLYEKLHMIVTDHLLVNPPSVVKDQIGENVAGFVAWRYPTKRLLEGYAKADGSEVMPDADQKQIPLLEGLEKQQAAQQHQFRGWKVMNKAGEPLDATGTTEALRVAEGLWLGAIALDREADKVLAETILEGYARHAYVDQGVWIIRNYFNLQNGAFSGNSYTIDYDADIVACVGKEASNQRLDEVARRTRELLVAAKSPAGLIHSVVQPEILTLMGKPGAYFSPNNIEQISNVVEVAERCAYELPGLSQGVLDFCMYDLRRLHLYYNAQTGDRVGETKSGLETFAPLLRLTVKHNDRQNHDAVLTMLLDAAQHKLMRGGEATLYDLSQTLLSLEISILYQSGSGEDAFEQWSGVGRFDEVVAVEGKSVNEARGETESSEVDQDEVLVQPQSKHQVNEKTDVSKKPEGTKEMILPIVVEPPSTQPAHDQSKKISKKQQDDATTPTVQTETKSTSASVGTSAIKGASSEAGTQPTPASSSEPK
ncbi:hypothetical protein [Poriferisphaera sp. WC338]|uniref:hypothetical protein n=1 Tax=Poriferisphaera sp. WC338 TaxID=3425129 RepID=UPI003D81BF68